MRRANYIVFIFAGVMCHETRQLHLFNFCRCNVSRLYNNIPGRDVALIWLEYSLYKNTGNFFQPYYGASQNYIVFISAGVMWHETRQLHRVYFCRCNVSRLYRRQT